MPLVSAIEREDAHGFSNVAPGRAQGSAREVDEGQAVRGCDASERSNPTFEGSKTQRRRRVRGHRCHVLPARDLARWLQRRQIHGAIRTHDVLQDLGCVAGNRSQVDAGTGRPLRQRAVAIDIRHGRPVARRRTGNVAQGRRRHVGDHHLVGRLRPGVPDFEAHRGLGPGGRERGATIRSVSRRSRPSGVVTTRCMSRESGASARLVMLAAEPSMKKRTPEKSPTPSMTPRTDATVRRGFRTRSWVT